MDDMRTVLNLSLPPKTAQVIKRQAKKRGFTTTSEYLRFLLSLDTELISADELLRMSRQADRDYRAGKLKKFSSLAKFL